jgi:hypothetical protein
MLPGLKWLSRQKSRSELSSTESGAKTTIRTLEFKAMENAVRFVEAVLDEGAGYVLIQTIEQIPQGVFYVVHVIENYGGTTPLGGCEKPPTTWIHPHLRESASITRPLPEPTTKRVWSERPGGRSTEGQGYTLNEWDFAEPNKPR